LASSPTRDDLLATLAAYENKIAQLETALVSNRRIGIAIGIVMASHGHTDQQAFDTLCALSQRHNRKLKDIAEDVIYTGTLPE
jgi:AmiR/NasT family two-component response regulator